MSVRTKPSLNKYSDLPRRHYRAKPPSELLSRRLLASSSDSAFWQAYIHHGFTHQVTSAIWSICWVQAFASTEESTAPAHRVFSSTLAEFIPSVPMNWVMEEWKSGISLQVSCKGGTLQDCAARRKPPPLEHEFYIILGKNHTQQSFSALVFPPLMPGKLLLFLHPLPRAAPASVR